jgi:hypothetical protein
MQRSLYHYVQGAGHHLDFLCVGLLTAACSVFGVPWVMGAIPHSPMHARVLATVVEYETRAGAGVASHNLFLGCRRLFTWTVKAVSLVVIYLLINRLPFYTITKIMQIESTTFEEDKVVSSGTLGAGAGVQHGGAGAGDARDQPRGGGCTR